MTSRLKTSEIPLAKQILTKQQGGRCAICDIDLSKVALRDRCLDHDHRTGYIRGVLCRNCNGIEGKVFNLANRGKRNHTPLWFIRRLLQYLEHHEVPKTTRTHPTHRTEDEKRLRRNALARKRRAEKKKKG